MKEFLRFSSTGFLCLALTLFLSFRAFSQVQTPRFISTGPNSNGFYEYLPAGYGSTGKTFPLMVFLHGSGEVGNGGSDLPKVLANGPPKLINGGGFPTSFTVNGQTFSFIVISPQFIQQASISDVKAVIDYANSHYQVDLNRVYLTGLSMGGGEVWSYTSDTYQNASGLAAILVIAGSNQLGAGNGRVIASANLPVFATHNLNDPTVPSLYTTENINWINNPTPPTPPAIDTIFNSNTHDAWTTTYDPTIALHNGLNVYQWMLQYSRNITVILPVTITDYSASPESGSQAVDVDWTTGIEQNNKYFILQRSADGHTFFNLDTIPAAASPGSGHSYIYTDHSPLAGNNFYRLEQVDEDGKATFFGVLIVKMAVSGGKSMQLSPNPTSGTIYLELVHPELGPLQVSLSDAQGKVLRVWGFQKQGLIWNQWLDPGNLAAGTYFLQVRGTTIREVRTFIKK